jgi:hypothetical protein
MSLGNFKKWLKSKITPQDEQHNLFDFDRIPLTEDPTDKFMHNLSAEFISANRGKRVAIHPQQGIIAIGKTLDEVYAKAKANGMEHEVVFDVIPSLDQ